MKKKLYLLSIPVVMALAFSCYEDKGNYDYTDIRVAELDIPSVAALGGEVRFTRYEDVRFEPRVTCNGKDAAGDYDYEWKIYPQNPVYDYDLGAYPPAEVIGEDPILEYHLSDVPNNYWIALKATHKMTGAVSTYTFKLVISAICGWIVLEEDASGRGDLTAIMDGQIIPGVSETMIFKDVYSASNDGAKFENAGWMYWRNMNNQFNSLFVYTGNGVYKLASGTFELSSTDYAAMFRTTPTTFAPQAMYYESPNRGLLDLVMNDGNLYYIRWNMMGQAEIWTGPVAISGVNVKCHPFIAGIPFASYANSSRGAMFNNHDYPEGSFIVSDAFGALGKPSVGDGQAFRTDNVGANMQLQYMATGRDGTTCALFRDANDDNRPYLYHADFRQFAAPAAIGRYDLGSVTGMSGAANFAFGTRGDVVFYTSGGNVYSHAFPGGMVNTLLTVGAGETVAQVKVYVNSVNPDYSGRILFVATNSASGGKVYKIRFNELTGAKIGDPEIFTGFGTIVDMTMKQS